MIQLFDKNHHVATPIGLVKNLNEKRIEVGTKIPIINRNINKLFSQHGTGAGMSATLMEFVQRSATPGQIELDQLWMENLATGVETQHVKRVKMPYFKEIHGEGYNLGIFFF